MENDDICHAIFLKVVFCKQKHNHFLKYVMIPTSNNSFFMLESLTVQIMSNCVTCKQGVRMGIMAEAQLPFKPDYTNCMSIDFLT